MALAMRTSDEVDSLGRAIVRPEVSGFESCCKGGDASIPDWISACSRRVRRAGEPASPGYDRESGVAWLEPARSAGLDTPLDRPGLRAIGGESRQRRGARRVAPRRRDLCGE